VGQALRPTPPRRLVARELGVRVLRSGIDRGLAGSRLVAGPAAGPGPVPGRPAAVGYQLADAGPHPNKMHAAWGRRAHRLEPDPQTEHMVRWMFAQRLAGHSVARIARALNDAGIPCPSAADPARNPHRAATAWTVPTTASILANPRYTGRQVWNRQRTDLQLADPADVSLGHRQVQRWNLPDGWVISARLAHPPLVSEADFIAAQAIRAVRGPAPGHGSPAARDERRYLLAGLLTCGACGRRMESCWSNGKAAYRCRHGRTSATGPYALLYARLDHLTKDEVRSALLSTITHEIACWPLAHAVWSG
jgi:site-specific DNA recombinase